MAKSNNERQKEHYWCKNNGIKTYTLKLPLHYALLVRDNLVDAIKKDTITKDDIKDFVKQQLKELK